MKTIYQFTRICIVVTTTLGLMAVAFLPGKAATLSGLVAHRAVYDVELLDASDRSGIRAMNGRMVYEIDGSACEGFAVKFRFVSRINTGRKSIITDQRTTTYEDAKGRNFRFVTKTYVNDQFEKEVRGSATRTGTGTEIAISKPESRDLQLGKAIFVTEHLARIIENALNGETIYTENVFDGSENGDELMATTTVIGRRSTKSSVNLPPSMVWMENMANWPVSVSYFSLKDENRGESLPVYQVSFKLYENGISSNLKMLYKDYSLKAKLNNLEVLPIAECEIK